MATQRTGEVTDEVAREVERRLLVLDGEMSRKGLQQALNLMKTQTF
jgi:hypothetical protein